MGASFEDVRFTDGHFCWSLKHFGLLFDDEDTVLTSRPFDVWSEHDRTSKWRWQLRARSRRLCQQSMLRVYVDLISLNEHAPSGRYAIRSYYRQSDASFDELDENLGHDLAATLREGDVLDVVESPRERFIGWAGTVSSHLTKYVHVKVRIFDYYGEGQRLQRSVALSRGPLCSVHLDEKMQRVFANLYQALLQNILIQCKQMNAKSNESSTRDSSTQTDPRSASVDWQEIAKIVIVKIVELVHDWKRQEHRQCLEYPSCTTTLLPS